MRLFLILALLLPTTLAAQEMEEPSAPPTPLRCDTPEHHQFDFWLGDWNVSADGLPAGTNSVQSIQGGCALQENWQGSGAGGVTGTSFNVYDRDGGNWHQTWVDASGTLLQLDGGLVDGVMVLKGKRPAPGGRGVTVHRIAWTPNPDGTVRQLWEASQDGGENWNIIFDGLYTRAEIPR